MLVLYHQYKHARVEAKRRKLLGDIKRRHQLPPPPLPSPIQRPLLIRDRLIHVILRLSGTERDRNMGRHLLEVLLEEIRTQPLPKYRYDVRLVLNLGKHLKPKAIKDLRCALQEAIEALQEQQDHLTESGMLGSMLIQKRLIHDPTESCDHIGNFAKLPTELIHYIASQIIPAN